MKTFVRAKTPARCILVSDLSGGRLRLSVLPAAAVAGSLHMQDAVNTGAIDGGHSVATWYDKNKAYSLFGTPPAFGWDSNTMLGWMKHGGGQELYDELLQKILKLNLVGFGAFSCVQRKARTGRNPKTGVAIDIPSKKVVRFRAGKGLSDVVNI